jgi:acetoin utilization deacetylase AcuC-like enzyme
MMKFERISHALLTTTSKTVAASKLPRPLVRSKEDFFRPPDFSGVPIEEWLDLLNDNANDGDNGAAGGTTKPGFGQRFLNRQLTREEARLIGFREQTHRPELVERTVLEVAGTVLTAQLALKYGIAANVAGGTHHAHPEGGAGYTILNDLAITTNLLTLSSRTTNYDSTALPNSSNSGRVDRVLVSKFLLRLIGRTNDMLF